MKAIFSSFGPCSQNELAQITVHSTESEGSSLFLSFPFSLLDKVLVVVSVFLFVFIISNPLPSLN